MRDLIAVEVARWTRTRRLLAVLLAAVFVGLTGPLSSYFLPSILAASVEVDGVTVDLPEQGVEQLIESFFSTSSQVLLLILAYMVSVSCSLGREGSLRIFYETRLDTTWRTLGPRLTVAAIFTVLAVTVASMLAVYQTWALTGDLPGEHLTLALVIHGLGLLVFTAISAFATAIVRSALVPPVAILGLSIAGGFLGGIERWRWLPTSLLQPDLEILGDEGVLPYGESLIVGLAVIAVQVVVIVAIDRRGNKNA